MGDIFALIQNGVIINTIIANPSDPQDPNYIWVDITNYNPIPGIGWTTTDNINFIPPSGD